MTETWPTTAATSFAPPVDLAAQLVDGVSATVRGKPEAVRLALVALLSGGHLLVEDLPGTGKTLLAKSLAAAIGGRFGRVQCTPDLLPTDITGTSVFLPGTGTWQFRPGPLFANVRAARRGEPGVAPHPGRAARADGGAPGDAWTAPPAPCPIPFFCVATQNPFGQVGTFPLPESQLDRFALVLTMGLPDRDRPSGRSSPASAGPRCSPPSPRSRRPAGVAAAVEAMRHVYCAPAVVEYVLDLAAATRSHPDLAVGASPRASIGLLQAARAHAVVAGRDYVTPDDVQAVVVPAFAHRVSLGGGVDTAGGRPSGGRHGRSGPGAATVSRAGPSDHGGRRAAVGLRGVRPDPLRDRPGRRGAAGGPARRGGPTSRWRPAAGGHRVVDRPRVADLSASLWPLLTVAAVRIAVRAPGDLVVGDHAPVEVTLSGRALRLEVRALDPPSRWYRCRAPGTGSMPHLADRRGVFWALRVEVRSGGPLGVCRRDPPDLGRARPPGRRGSPAGADGVGAATARPGLRRRGGGRDRRHHRRRHPLGPAVRHG